MHLFFENIVRNLLNLWRGNFKGLDAGSEDYEIEGSIWEEIWAETAAAVKDILAQFVRSMTDGPSKFTAEAWCFCLYTWHQFFSTVRNTMITSVN
jgi:hypothetical protein